MKKYLRILLLAVIAVCSFTIVSCGDDDDDKNKAGEITEMYGLWVCITSEDSWQGYIAKDQFVGEELTINSDGTYTSTAESFGYTGKWSVSGNSFVAKTSYGKSITATFSVSGNYMTLSGKTNEGVTFNYHFKRK